MLAREMPEFANRTSSIPAAHRRSSLGSRSPEQTPWSRGGAARRGGLRACAAVRADLRRALGDGAQLAELCSTRADSGGLEDSLLRVAPR
jgi:hypothetical protein